ncbi:MAG: Outer membrane TonB-dependent transporter, utilization system for glycans and polysaccharides (PUL), SusC family [uncultured Gemmatimonadaceae bacterium]|uniref:Outer membrane TonB-dependent transporter, utilization system for glycans and polysaccharides (PUL), SusC family n=1 Tax=uncultured Gemmatimonadaceae bacterium TaxID=246130 RepID=A0A6J4LB52_9BACT|nr:MAG: Outer membrane TonB-dependent transporter, utilization system for glycans and polysaccharides (PUL), SusC family [uncultured Gemmatimonadaceae bacterium]
MIRQCRFWLAGALVALGAAPGVALAQVPNAGTVAGRIVDATSQQPISSATIVLVGTQRGTITAGDGTYRLAGVTPGQVTIRVQRIGYVAAVRPITVAAGETATLNVALAASAVQLSEVVTTATGTQRRVELGNSTANVNAAQVVENTPIRNVSDLLTARAPGVQVLPNTFTGGGARVRIRGTSSLSLSNDPIYIIDGIRMTSNTGSSSIGVGGTLPSRVGDINPDEIENIEVVKGPSAATLYGTDAANGVILITTKRGAAGNTKYTTYVEQGLVQDRNNYPTNLSLNGRRAGAVTSVQNCLLTQIAVGNCAVDSLSRFNPIENDETTPYGNGYRQQYGGTVSGGTATVRFFTSGEFESETGVTQTPEFERTRFAASNTPILEEQERPNALERASFRLNLNAAPSPKLDLALSSGYINLNQRFPQSDNNITGLFYNILGGPGIRDTTRNGYRDYTPGDIFQQNVRQRVDRFIGSVNANWRPLEWLAARANVGTDFSNRVDTDLCRRGNCADFGTRRQGFATDNRTILRNTSVDLNTAATFDLNESVNSKTTLGAQYINYRFNRNGASSVNLPGGATTVTSGATQSADEATDLSKTLGLFIEEQVAIRDRLFLTGALRTDQNSAFGTDFQRVIYPKASVSYIVSDEAWFRRPTWLNQLRLRSSYGASGTQPGANDALRFFSTSNVSIAGTDQPSIIFNALGNTNLKPERSTEFEGGFEARVLEDRLSFDITYYSKLSRDALIARVLPPSLGVGATTVFDNIGEVKNAGLEALINARLVDRPTFGWDVTFNGSTNANRLVTLGDVPPVIGTTIRQVEGFPLNGYWQRRLLSYNDRDQNGIITTGEVVVADSASFIGYSTPRHEIAFTNGFDLFKKQLRVQTLFDYKGGHRLYNNTERFRCQSFGNCTGRADPNASLFEQARAVALTEDPSRTFAGYMEKADFIRFRELSVTYSTPADIASRLFRAQSASVSLSARNLGVFTKYTGIDPETNYTSNGDVPNDFFTLPPQSYFTLRVNVGF